jgi:hypothetical protein
MEQNTIISQNPIINVHKAQSRTLKALVRDYKKHQAKYKEVRNNFKVYVHFLNKQEHWSLEDLRSFLGYGSRNTVKIMVDEVESMKGGGE